MPLRGKAKTGSESRAASIVHDVNNESLSGTGGNKWYNTRENANGQRVNNLGTTCFIKTITMVMMIKVMFLFG